MADLLNMMRSHLAQPQAYVGGIHSSRLGAHDNETIPKVIKLNANENPYPPLEEIIASLSGLPIHEYPDQHQTRIRWTISEYVRRPVQQIIAGSGSDEIIELLIRLFIAPGEAMIDCPPTFGMYEFCARIAQAELIPVERTEDWEIDIQATVKAISRHRAKMLFIASPNNPTGNLLPQEHARVLLETDIVLVVDETYHEFCGESLAGLLDSYNNLVLLRSFSKWAGIAGLRIGYAIASELIIRHLMAIKQPFNVNLAAEAAALAALKHQNKLQARIETIIHERQRIEAIINTLPGMRYAPSRANFLLIEFENLSGAEADQFLAERGVFIRRFSSPRLDNAIRISIGTPEQNDAVIGALQAITSASN